MNQKGNLLILIAVGIILTLALPAIIMTIFPQAKIIFQLISIFLIYSLVRGYLGPGPLTIIVSAVLIYFLVFKWLFVFGAIWIFQTLLGLSWFSVIIWGSGTMFQKMLAPKPGG